MLRAILIGAWLAAAAGCSSSGDKAKESGAADGGREAGVEAGLVPVDPTWAPGTALPSLGQGPRGLLDLRGLIHEHSVYSHDACDGVPRDPATDAIDEACLDDFRAGLCGSGHDFAFLTDHDESFSRTEFPDVLLYRSDRGDELVERGGFPVANRLACPDDHRALVLAGTESNAMPVGLERHVAPDPAARSALYNEKSEASLAAFREAGAVVLLAHTEDYTPDELVALPVDGFEMYNLHANLELNIAGAATLLAKLNQPDLLMQSDLVVLAVFSEDPRYMDTWSTVLARGERRVTTVGTDAHRNSLPMPLPDGDRVDSWARMNRWFSNHLLVRAGTGGEVDDRALKDALRAGRLYAAFEFLGYPAGFDFHAKVGSAVHEMGQEVSLAAGATLVVRAPSVRGLDPAVTAPEITTKIYRATEGPWQEVASGTDLEFTPTLPGAYRAEARMTPRHLEPHLNDYVDFASKDVIWVYSNPIYVVE